MFSGVERTILILIVFVYFMFLFGLSLYVNRKNKTYEDYNVASRTVSLFPLILTFVGTAVGGSTLLGYMENGYRFGMGQQWINITVAIGVMFFGFFLVKRIRYLGEKHNMITLGDFTAMRYGEKARIPTVISVLFYYCSITGMQFLAIGTVLNLTIGIDLTLGILIGWVLLTLKTYFGGLKAVIWQDTIHGTIQTLGIFFLFATVIIVAGGWSGISEAAKSVHQADMISLLNIKPNEVFVYLLTLGFYQGIRQDLWQRVWAAKSLKTAMNGYAISMIIALLTGAVVVAIGVFGRFGFHLEIDPVYIYYGIIENLFPFPIVVIMIIVILVTIISCADSFFIAGSSSIVNDIIRPNVKQFSDKKMLFYSKMSVLIVSVISLILVLFIPGLVNLMVTGTAMSVSGLLAPVIFGLYWKKIPHIAGIVSMWTGLVTSVIWQGLGHPFGLHPVFIGLPLSIAVLLMITLAFKQNNNTV